MSTVHHQEYLNTVYTQRVFVVLVLLASDSVVRTRTTNTYCVYTGLSKKLDGIWKRYNLKSTGRIYTFSVLKCSEKFKVLDVPY